MNNKNILDKRLETMAWGALFIWWGLRWWLLVSLPNGVGLLGTALILLGLNAARLLKGIPTRETTTIVGILMLLLGGLILVLDTRRVSSEIPMFQASLIVLGAFLLVRELLRMHKANIENLY